MRKAIILFLLTILILPTYGQGKEELAAHFYQEKDYQKAADIYKKLFWRKPKSIYFYDNLLNCYLKLKQYPEAEKTIKKGIRKNPGKFIFKVDNAYILSQKGEKEAAEKQYVLLKNLTLQIDQTKQLAGALLKRDRTDDALFVYLKSRENQTDNNFSEEISSLYLDKGAHKNFVKEVLNNQIDNTSKPADIKNQLMRASLTPEVLKTIRREILLKINNNPDEPLFTEILIWSFVHNKDWEGAFIQSKALDLRQKSEGVHVLNLSSLAISNSQFDMAYKCLVYIKNMGKEGTFFSDAEKGLLRVGFKKAMELNNMNKVEIQKLLISHEQYLQKYGRNWSTFSLIKQYASLLMFRANNPKKSIKILEKTEKIPGIRKRDLASTKLLLGDAYIMEGELWEPQLLYTSVEIDFKDEALGQEAKYKNARLAYFRGEFEWAKSQLDVLKGATTQLISNNAIDLSLYILENTGLDSNENAMKLFAKSELLLFRNQFDAALSVLDTILIRYPAHSLEDEIYFEKGKIYTAQKNFDKAIEYYTKVYKNHSFDILADNALFNIAKLYDYTLSNPEKAKETYQTLILEHTSSLFVVEARRRYRALRKEGKSVN